MKLNIKVEYNNLSEYQRYIFICLQIYRKFYQNKRYFLTYNYLKNEERQVIIPDVDTSKVPSFWNRIANIADDYHFDRVTEYSKELLGSGINIEGMSEKNLKTFSTNIQQYLEDAFTDISKVFPEIENKEINVTILPSLYGTNGSFEKAVISNKSVNIQVTVRIDKPLDYLLEIIVSSIVWGTKYQHINDINSWQNEWEINESLVDFLLTHTAISNHITDYITTVKSITEPEIIDQSIIEDSKAIFEKLGYPLAEFITIKDEDILIKGKPSKARFTTTEKKIVKHLTENKGHLTTNEDLGRIIWGNNLDKQSLWAIAKYIQRIRDKIKQNGIASEIIRTVRGQGYLLYD